MADNQATIAVVAERINSLHGDVTELRDTMKESVKEMSLAIQTLVRMEEKQLASSHVIEKLSDTVYKLEGRLDVLEREQPMTKQVVTWGLRAIWGIVAVAAAYVAKTLGLM